VLAAAVFLYFRSVGAPPIEISAAQAYDKYQQGALFLDVRSQEEWSQARIPNSLSLPLDVLTNHLDELTRDRDIVVVCSLGLRSKEGVTILRGAGFPRASCMSGGLQAWQAAGYPLERGTPGRRDEAMIDGVGEPPLASAGLPLRSVLSFSSWTWSERSIEADGTCMPQMLA
jgi:rhodanese-related sulfurtransferase